MDIDEKPLVVQLNWNKDDREGRFVLKNENDAVPPKVRVGAAHLLRICCASAARLLRVCCTSAVVGLPDKRRLG